MVSDQELEGEETGHRVHSQRVLPLLASLDLLLPCIELIEFSLSHQLESAQLEDLLANDGILEEL